jgi:hypothetical protein
MMSFAPEVGPGWRAIVAAKAGGRKSRGMGATQIDAIVAARRAYEHRRAG